jgi:hypothetical protein
VRLVASTESSPKCIDGARRPHRATRLLEKRRNTHQSKPRTLINPRTANELQIALRHPETPAHLDVFILILILTFGTLKNKKSATHLSVGLF